MTSFVSHLESQAAAWAASAWYVSSASSLRRRAAFPPKTSDRDACAPVHTTATHMRLKIQFVDLHYLLKINYKINYK
jgi:hypothetical protein